MLRLFIGISLKNQVFLSQYQQKIKTFLPKSKISWVPPNNYHVTLKFLGKTEEYCLNSIKTILKELALKHANFNLEYSKAGYFGDARYPKALWFGFNPDPNIELLQQTIDSRICELGYEMEKRRYTPHITLARIKQFNDDSAWLDFMNASPSELPYPLHVNEFQLFKSELSERGATYTILKNFKLEG